MKEIRRLLLYCFWGPVFVSLLLVAFFETDVLPAGEWSDNKVLEYYCAGAMELITICTIPLALRLFKWKKVTASIMRRREQGLLRWGVVRLGMVGVPMAVNTFFYYQFIHVAFGYMAIIGLLSMMFVYPSAERCMAEMSPDD